MLLCITHTTCLRCCARLPSRPTTQGGSGALASTRSDIAWSHPLAMLLLGVRNLGLSGWMLSECAALEHEVSAWQQEGVYSERDNALRWGPAGVHKAARGGCARMRRNSAIRTPARQQAACSLAPLPLKPLQQASAHVR